MRNAIIVISLLCALAASGRSANADPYSLTGLSAEFGSYEFAKEFKLPANFSNLSGVVANPVSDGMTIELWAVTDGRHTNKRPEEALVRMRVDLRSGELEIVETHRLATDYKDLEGIAADWSNPNAPVFFIVDEGNRFIGGCASRLHIVGPTGSPIYPSVRLNEIQDKKTNVCAEAVAFRDTGPAKILYVFKERNPDGTTPLVYEYHWRPNGEAVFVGKFQIDKDGLADQAGVTVSPGGDRLLVVHRSARELVEIDPRAKGPGLPAIVKIENRASYRKLVEDKLGYVQSKYPMVEGAAAVDGHLFLAVDNNAEAVGRPKDKAARLLWFRRAGASQPHAKETEAPDGAGPLGQQREYPAEPLLLASVEGEKVPTEGHLPIEIDIPSPKKEGALARLSLMTALAVPPGRVHYGLGSAENDLAQPVYRQSAKLEFTVGTGPLGSAFYAHFDLGRLERFADGYRSMKRKDATRAVYYRVEIYDPRDGSVRFFDGKFGYRPANGKPGGFVRAPMVVDGPWIDRVTHEEATLSWTTDLETDGSLTLFDDRIGRSINDARAKLDRRHLHRLRGLKPSTRYAYEFEALGAPQIKEPLEGPYSFKTLSEDPNATVRWAFLSDSRSGYGGGERSVSGVNADALGGLLEDAYRRGADFILFGGDLIDGYTSNAERYARELAAWKRVAAPVGAKIPIYEAMGNHEFLGTYWEISEGASNLTGFRSGTDLWGPIEIFSDHFVNPNGSFYDLVGAPQPERCAVCPHDEDRLTGLTVIAPNGQRKFQQIPRKGPEYGESVYSFQAGPVHFAVLNTNYWTSGSIDGALQTDKALVALGGGREGYLMQSQLRWLEDDLAQAQRDSNIKHIIVVGHEPAFPAGGHVRDAMWWDGLDDPQRPLGDVVTMRDRFWSLLAGTEKTRAYLAGDEHNFSMSLIGDQTDTRGSKRYLHPVWQMVSGGAGAPYYALDRSVPWIDAVKKFSTQWHYCLFEANGERLRMAVYGANGKVISDFEDLVEATRTR